MRKSWKRSLAGLLAVVMLVTTLPVQALAAAGAEEGAPQIQGDPENGFTLADEAGGQIQADENWEEDYPNGLLALEYSQLTATEGGTEQILTIYRLGGTAGKISAVMQYMPVVTQNEDGSNNFTSALSADDLVIQVEDPLPVADYQAWGEKAAPEPTGTAVLKVPGVDGEGLACQILSLNLEREAEAYQWQARELPSGDWEEVEFAEGPKLPVGDEELAQYDFRCVFVLDGVRYCTNSLQGEVYEKPAPEELPEAPADLELNPDPTYTTLDLTQGDTPYDGLLFEVTFAEGEYKKEIRITAQDDGEAEADEFATLTISDSVGGDVLESMNTLMLRVADNDQAAAEPAQIGFAARELSFDKSEGTARITVRRTGGDSQTLSVDWALEEGTARPGVDYADASGTLYFYAGQTEQVIEVELIDDQVETAEEKFFTMRLSNLRGDDASSLAAGVCTVGLFNTNTAQEQNLPSALSDVEAVDISGGLDEAEHAPMASGTVTGSQNTDRSEPGVGTVDWNDGTSLFSWDYNNGNPIAFSGGNWSSAVTENQSLTSSGNNNKTTSIPNMCKLYNRFSTWVKGGAGLASGWDRLWYGDKEYAYTYFEVTGQSPSFYGDVNPQFSKSGLKVHLSYHTGFSVSGNLDYNGSYQKLVLGTKTYESRSAEDNINSSASTTLYRRTFSNPFYLTAYTANDENVDGVAHYAGENYNNIISGVAITNGGTSGGRLYEGSTVEIRLGETHLECTDAYLVDANGNKVWDGTPGNGNKTITFSDLLLPPDGTYTFRIVLERRQDMKVDVTTSTVSDGTVSGGSEADNQAAYDLLLSKNTKGGKFTLGYTPTNTLTGSKVGVSTKEIGLSDGTFDRSSGVLTIPYTEAAANLQWINFNLSEKDVVVLNGKSYAGNAQIPLESRNLTTKSLQFYFYEEEFLTVERPMKVTLDATALYYDGNGNGKIDGYYNQALGTFVVDESSGDTFVSYLDGDYEETDFQPVVKDGKVHQYFLRPYYTANAVAITVPQGHSADERMQVMPSFITDVTDSTVYETLTGEQREYRTIISGQTTIRENAEDSGETGYSADNHLKYTAAATAYSYVDIPLGGDTNPSRQMTGQELGHPEDGTCVKDGVKYQILNGLAYYYAEGAASNMGNAVFVWKPEYEGHLLYPYEAPQPITIAQSIAGRNIPIAGAGGTETWYQKADGAWTKEAPSDDGAGYAKNAIGAYVTEERANTKGAERLNAYLGAFGSNDTFALTVQEQTQTTGGIIGGRSFLASLFDSGDGEEKGAVETVTRGTVGSFPNSDYLKQNSGSGASGSGSSAGKGAYTEFSTDAAPELFAFSSEALAAFSVETDGYEVTMSFGLPVYGKDNGGGTGSAANTFDDVKDTVGKVKKFINAIKSKGTNPAKELAGEDLDANNLKSKSIEFNVNVSFAITLKYNTLDNTFVFSDGALAAAAGVEVRLQYRFTPVPIIYVYAQFSLEFSVTTGLGQNRYAELGDPILRNAEVKLTGGSGGDSQDSQYYFTAKNKGFQLTFSGKVYMEAYKFTDQNNDGTYEPGTDTLGEKLDSFNPGYLSSDGKKPTEVILVAQDGFALKDNVVVVFTVMNNGDDSTATLTDLVPIVNVRQDLYWDGLQFGIEGAIELGAGIGIEIAKFEIFAKASVGLAFGFGEGLGSEEGYDKVSFDEFTLSLGLGFRAVFLFFNYEQDLISYTLTYDGEKDKWEQSWSALGGKKGGDLPEPGSRTIRVGDGPVEVRITPPSQVAAQVYDNGVTGQDAGISPFAFEPSDENVPFEVSGYGSSVNAFQLMGGVQTGYDYQIVTVGDDNYVVYTGTRSGGAAVDNTELWLSRLEVSEQTDGDNQTYGYGFVNPIAGGSAAADQNYIPVDGDGTGDLDFYTWAGEDGKTIHVIWVSYREKGRDDSAKPSGDPYKDTDGTVMDENNYQTFVRPEEPDYMDEPTEVSEPVKPLESDYYVTAEVYGNLPAEQKSKYNPTPAEEEGTQYYFVNTYSSFTEAKEAFSKAENRYQTDLAAYQKYQDDLKEYQEYRKKMELVESYDAWYAYYSGGDIQNQITAASRNTVVKHAVFDSKDPDAKGFTEAGTLNPKGEETYYFLPQIAGDAAVYAQSVLYTDDELKARLKEYSNYLEATAPGSDDNIEDPHGYLDASKAYRLNYQQSLLSVYGGNSRLTVTGPDGTAYAGGTINVSQQQNAGDDTRTNEIITNLDMTQVGDAYYLSYVTQQDLIQKDELTSISRLYLRTFNIVDTTGAPTQKVEWGEPYLLRTVVNAEQDSGKDGIYARGALKTAYTDAYLSNVSFLTAKLGDSLPEGETGTFEPFSAEKVAQPETFLLFEMNGSTYVIRESSLKSITDPGGEHTGTINPFFTPEQVYGDAIDEDEAAQEGTSLSSGKGEVVIGADGDGNVAAVYTASVPNTVNNAIYLSYWDPEAGKWSPGVMLAMNHMTVYERSVARNWDDAATERAYFDEAQGGGMDQFLFSNLQVALGRADSGGGEEGGATLLDGLADLFSGNTATVEADSAEAGFGSIAATLGITPASDGDGAARTASASANAAERYALREQAELLGADTGTSTAPSSELLILTQGALTRLGEYVQRDDEEKTLIVPENTEGDAEAAQVGVYAISYGKGEQQVGSVNIQFAYDEFTTGTELYASVAFANVGDASIRGSKEQPITVRLMLHSGSQNTELASWSIEQSITAGQTVRLATDQQPCAPLTRDLGDGDYFYLTVEESDDYAGQGGVRYTYNSDTESKESCQYTYRLESRAELGVENLTGSVAGVEQDGRIAVDVSFDVTNRGDATAEDAFVQFSYLSGYDADSGEAVYTPLNITGSDLYVSQEKLITSGALFTLVDDDYSIGVLALDTDDTYYTADYYISKADYDAILGRYYSTTEKDGWTQGAYNGVTYWYDAKYYGSAYAAYTAGQEAVADWVHDSQTGNYYKSDYASYPAAKAAADAARKMEYILTQEQYNALPASEQSAWKLAGGYYIPVGYKDLTAAEEAYQAALESTKPQIRRNYQRTVEGTLYVSPKQFCGRETGSLELRVEVFHQSSSASRSAESLYTSEHSDEYNALNNQAELSLEQEAFFSAADRVVLGQYGSHRLPVTVRTTTGEAPALQVLEVEDGRDELGTLNFTASADTDGNPATVTGYLTVVGSALGEGVIHLVDTATNTTYPIVYRVETSGDGINIFSDDAQFTFYNADGKPYDPAAPAMGQSWTFQSASAWTDQQTVPYLSNLSVGEKGASFTFETQGSELEFDLIGTAAVTSSRFPGTWTIQGDENDPASQMVDFSNDSGVTHTVAVTITSEQAWFDVLRVAYGQEYTPSDDSAAPGLYFSRSFPAAGSVQTGTDVEFTVYAVDDSGLQNMTLTGDGFAIDGEALTRMSDGLWAYRFTVTGNGTFTVLAADTSGKTTTRTITVDWFADNPQNPDAGKAPELEASLWKDYADEGTPDEKITSGVVITAEEIADNIAKGEFRVGKPDSGNGLTYSKYSAESARFGEVRSGVTEAVINGNGIYLVRADAIDSSGTWSQQLFYVSCFDTMPQVMVTYSEEKQEISWSVAKDSESTAALESAELNDAIPLAVNGTALAGGTNAFSGTFPIQYGGRYTVTAVDETGIKGSGYYDAAVPVDLSRAEIATVQPWGQPDEQGARYGAITIDFTKVTGGNYLPESAKDADSLDSYYGSYQYLVLTKAEYEANGDENLDELTGWQDAAHDATVTWDGLQAAESMDYVLLVRDAQNPNDSNTMAEYEFTLTDNAVDYTSLSASLASTPTAEDGKVFVSADKGETGAYEFAILPVEDGQTLEGTAFRDAGWQLANWDTPQAGTLTGLSEGRYQVAIRALHASADAIAAANEAGRKADEADGALDALLRERDGAAETMVRSIGDASNGWLDAAQTLKELEDSGTAAEEELAAARAAVAEAKAAYETALSQLPEATQNQIQTLRETWAGMEEGEEKEKAWDSYETAVAEACQTCQQEQYADDIEAAAEALAQAEAVYAAAAAKVTEASAAAYTEKTFRWDGVLTGEGLQISVKSGEGTALKAAPTVASGSDEADGSIQVTAEGGSAYDGGGTVHYQFAILPLDKEEDAVDYTGRMEDLAGLELDWQFADDLLTAPEKITFDGLLPGWYQVFVRAAYDPDITDDYDLNEHLAAGAGNLPALRLAYETAKAAADESGVAAATDQAHSLYLAWLRAEGEDQKEKTMEALRQFLGGTAEEQDKILELANTWQELPEKPEEKKQAAYKTYRAALTERIAAKANAALSQAEQAYTTLRDDLAEQVAEAYEQAPGYYDTASFATACVGVRSYSRNYAVIVAEAEHGTVAVSPKRTWSGHTVTITAKPDEGYKVGTIMVTRETGGIVSVSDKGEGVYTFTMPNSDVEVKVTFVPVSEWSNPFVDVVEGAWYYDAVQYVNENGLMAGTSVNTFAPDLTTTRGMIVTILYRLEGTPNIEGEIWGYPFRDVDANAWYATAVYWARMNGIVAGYSDELFGPDDTITREQMATILYRYAQYKGCDTTAKADLSKYTDAAQVGSWATDAIRWANAEGLVSGTSATTLTPKGSATRSQVAVILMRFCQNIVK